MESTSDLIVKTSLYAQTDVHIHPNDGFDLGIMNTKSEVKIFGNTTVEVFNKAEDSFTMGNIVLDNKCKHNEITMSNKYWKKIGSPEKVRLFYDNNKILISNS